MSQMVDPINIKLFLVSTYPVSQQKIAWWRYETAFMRTFSVPEVSHNESEETLDVFQFSVI